MKIPNEVLAVLDTCSVGERAVMLPVTLDRKLYTAVNNVLQCLGGTWNRKLRSHVFADDFSARWDEALSTGEVVSQKTELQYFPTPAGLARKMVMMAGVKWGDSVLEPSAGQGAIVKAIRTLTYPVDVVAVEIHPPFCADLCEIPNVDVLVSDFLALKAWATFDRVVMNPPFANQADIDHVRYAHSFLKDGGTLVACMSPGWQFRSNKKSVEFRAWLSSLGAQIEEVPAGTFKESGTMIRTVLVKIGKPGVA